MSNRVSPDCHALRIVPQLAALILYLTASVPAEAGEVTLHPVRDNTLFEYDPTDPTSSLNSNGLGDFFSAGRTLSRNLIRRGLIQFDLSDLPRTTHVVPGSARLGLYVTNAPRQDAAARPFWLTPATLAWSEGTSLINNGSGAGSGTHATQGDATWFHTSFDPAIHAEQPFQSNAPGYWSLPGALGDAPIDPLAQLGPSLGTILSQVGPAVLAGTSLEADLNHWLGGVPNAGWIVVGDESIHSATQSSLRSFASREHANPEFWPQLSFSYVVSDLNDDHSIDAGDAALLFATWGTNAAEADIVPDGLIDAADAGAMFAEWTGDMVGLPEPGATYVMAEFLAILALGRRYLASRMAQTIVARMT